MSDKFAYEESTKINSGNYKFEVYSVETSWKGDGSLRDEGMPGNFLNQRISLIGCKNPSKLEDLAVEMKVVLWKSLPKETTGEPEDYAKLKHQQLIKEVKKDSNYYLQNLRQAVKERL